MLRGALFQFQILLFPQGVFLFQFQILLFPRRGFEFKQEIYISICCFLRIMMPVLCCFLTVACLYSEILGSSASCISAQCIYYDSFEYISFQ